VAGGVGDESVEMGLGHSQLNGVDPPFILLPRKRELSL
jgi:hypothetical protein